MVAQSKRPLWVKCRSSKKTSATHRPMVGKLPSICKLFDGCDQSSCILEALNDPTKRNNGYGNGVEPKYPSGSSMLKTRKSSEKQRRQRKRTHSLLIDVPGILILTLRFSDPAAFGTNSMVENRSSIQKYHRQTMSRNCACHCV